MEWSRGGRVHYYAYGALVFVCIVVLPLGVSAMSFTSAKTVFDHHPISSFGGYGENGIKGDTELLVDPRNTNIMYRAGEGAGVLKSTDGGLTWTPKNIGLPNLYIEFIRMHPTDSSRLYVGLKGQIFSAGGQVYRSFDAGESWQPTIICDGQGDAQNMNIAAWSQDLAIDPTDPSRAYYGVHINFSRGGCGGLYRTTDDFQTYAPNPSCVSDPTVTQRYADNDVGKIIIKPGDPATVYAIAGVHPDNNSFQTSHDYGKNFYFEHVLDTRNSFLPPSEWYLSSLYANLFDVAPSNPNIMYADFGQQDVRRRLDSRLIPSKWANFGDPTIDTQPAPIIVRTDGSRSVSAVDGVGDNDEDGRADQDYIWRPIFNLQNLLPGNTTARNVYLINVHPTDPNLIFVMASARAPDYETLWNFFTLRPSNPSDLSQEWQASLLWQTKEFERRFFSFTLDPVNSNHGWILQTDAMGYVEQTVIVDFRTSDQWRTAQTTATPQPNQHYWVNKFDVGQGPSGPRIFAATTRDVVYSSDGGETWVRQPEQLYNPMDARAISVSPADQTSVYVSEGRFGMQFPNAGTSSRYWSDVRNIYRTVCTSVMTDLAGDPAASNALWMATDAGLYHHTNLQFSSSQDDAALQQNGMTWSRVATRAELGTSDEYLWRVVVDPQNQNRVLVGARTDGIFLSSNGGGSWSRRLSGVSDVRDIELGTSYSYAATAQGVYRSQDRGSTWTPTQLSGRTYDVALDPYDSSVVYAATHTGLFRSIDAGATWTSVSSADPPPFVAVYAGTHLGVPFLLSNGGGKGIRKTTSDVSLLRGDASDSIVVRVPLPASTIRVSYGATPALSGTDAIEGASPVSLVPDASGEVRLTGLSGNTYYIAVTNASPTVQPRGFVHRIDRVDADLPPVALTATAQSSIRINLSWTDTSSGESGFWVERRLLPNGAFTKIADLPANASSYADSQVSPNTSYVYRVAIRDAEGNMRVSNTANASTNPNAGATQGLIGSWAFDENSGTDARDSSGNDNHGTLRNGAGWTPLGRVQSALECRTPSSTVEVLPSQTLALSGDFTLAGWVRFEATTSTPRNLPVFADIVGQGTFGPQRPYNLSIVTVPGPRIRAQVRVRIAGTVYTRNSLTDLASNTWHHVAGVREGGVLRIYTNGALSTSSVIATGPIDINTNFIRIGSEGNSGTANQFDDVRVYNRALSSQEISDLAANNLDRTAPTAPANMRVQSVLSAFSETTSIAATIIRAMSAALFFAFTR